MPRLNECSVCKTSTMAGVCPRCQHTLKESWGVVHEQVKRSKRARFNWRGLLGRSLSRYLREMYEAGLEPAQVIASLFVRYPWLTEEAKRRAVIASHARYAEFRAHNIVKVKA